ncbi:MAG: protein kinase, partial [Planctomycetes bacterium]|nr:protein kinase [Planctomycetota bacterium]
MAGKFSVKCSACGKAFRVGRVVPGKMPKCASCGGELELAQQVRFACGSCGAKSKPSRPAIDTPILCPKCGKGMEACADAPVVSKVDKNDSAEDPWDGIGSEDRTVQFTPSRNDDNSVASSTPDSDATIPCASPALSGAALVDASGGNDDTSFGVALENGKPGGLRKSNFGKYEIISEIARGGMGIVYKAYDPTLKRTVALKVLIAGEGATEDGIKRFLREARSAGRIKHPNIVPIHEVGEIEGQYYFTMDFVEGKDLSDVAYEGKVPLRELLESLYDVCRALEDAHKKGIIHRDLKPQNILLDSEGRAYLTDFGLAKDMTSQSIQSVTGSVFGTPAYMSPEQAQGKTHEID